MGACFSLMKRNTAYIFLALAAGVAGYLFLISGGMVKRDGEAPTVLSPLEAPPVQPAPEPEVSEDRKRIAAMRAGYAELEQARDTVRRQLARLKSKLWKLKVPPDQARAISEQVQRGHALLKNPPMLGAFSSVGEIRQELARINRVSNKLSALEVTVEEYISARETR